MPTQLTARFSLVVFMLALLAVFSAHAKGPLGHFNPDQDLFLAQFDSKTDVDDVHSVAGVATMLRDPRFAEVKYHAVAGAYGIQEGLYVPSPRLFNLSFGDNWSDAHNNRVGALAEVSKLVLATLQRGGHVWIAEAGQSDFTADWLMIVQDQDPSIDTQAQVHVVQHSDWNESSAAPEKLAYVKQHADYQKIADGNALDNGTPGLRTESDAAWELALGSAQNEDIWNLARAIGMEYNGREGRYNNSAIADGGMDFSDVSESCWIFGFAKLRDVAAFFVEFHASPAVAFHALLQEHWAVAEREQIFFRTDADAFRLNGKLPEFTPAARARRQAYNEEILSRLKAIDASSLEGQDRISFKLFRYERETEREFYKYYDHRLPIRSGTGYHSYFGQAPGNMAFNTVGDYEKYLVSLADFPRYNRENMALMQEGVETGYTQYCQSMEGYESTISEFIVEDVSQSVFYAPFLDFPTTVPENLREDLSTRGGQLIQDQVIPAYQDFYRFFTEEYQPNCRTEVGITSLEGGEDYYNYLIRFFTTTDMTPREIHELGLIESKRIRAEMEAVINSVGFEGSFQEFLEFMRTDSQFYAESSQDLLEKTAFITQKMDGLMPRYFGTLARNTYELRPTEGRGAYYVSGEEGGKTAGIYFLNVTDLKAQPLYNLEALSLHEAVPGHHHQSALAMELDLPEFRKTLYHAGFGEGWGLYAESLGKEVGFYQNPYSDFGRLTYEMWRANRLVVDTGMHAFGWSRQQAIDYLMESSAMTLTEVTSEVDRYITWPGQALAYKIGELRIKALREKAETTLGANFDIRAFHDVIVGNGSLALAVLEEVVDEWLVEQQR